MNEKIFASMKPGDTPCFCVGRQGDHPECPCQMRTIERLKRGPWTAVVKEKEQSGFFDLPNTESCGHPQHNFPSHLVIPYGKGYRHVCPGCGATTIARGSSTTMAAV